MKERIKKWLFEKKWIWYQHYKITKVGIEFTALFKDGSRVTHTRMQAVIKNPIEKNLVFLGEWGGYDLAREYAKEKYLDEYKLKAREIYDELKNQVLKHAKGRFFETREVYGVSYKFDGFEKKDLTWEEYKQWQAKSSKN